MKHISIIIPIKESLEKAISIDQNLLYALSHIHYELGAYNVDYEIIILTDSNVLVPLQDIEVFPKRVQVKLCREKETKNISELCIKGFTMAQYEYIGIVGTQAEYIPGMLTDILADLRENTNVIATIKTESASFLPFFFNMRTHSQQVALFFSKAVWDTIAFEQINDAIFFLEFLKRAQAAGFLVKQKQFSVPKKFGVRFSRVSVVDLLSASKDTIHLLIKKIPPISIAPKNHTPMLGAGVVYKKQKYITHTTLSVQQSALQAFDLRVLLLCFFSFLICLIVLLLNPLFFIQCFIGIVSSIYLIDIGFNMFLVLQTFQKTTELSFTQKEIEGIIDAELPLYSILCPLYKEAHILPQFIKELEKLDWPKDKLEAIILLESDDHTSIQALQTMQIPDYIHPIIVPDSLPKTKPKACNYGLAFVQGTYTVIYDAEDIPDPLQLKKAYLGFQKSDKNVACLQAKLNFYNVHQNLLTRFFTAEYSLWFDITLPSLNTLHTVIPLGGTSNHFRTGDLQKLHAWDPFNVTEDADLGMRLFKLGYQTAILDSVTLEEGNSQLKNWIRQRSRWIKGYMQTYLVHTKEHISFIQARGIHAFIFHLVIGGKLAFIIINPFLWLVTIIYFLAHSIVGPVVDSWYPPFVLYVAMLSLIFGNYLYVLCHILGCVKKGQWSLIKYVYLIPVYWVLISIAGFIALYQLIFKPFYWEKTTHGLHLKETLAFT